MQGEPAEVTRLSNDAGRHGLEFAHRLVAAETPPTLAEVLPELARAFGVEGAGAAALLGGPPLGRASSLAPPAHWPWETDQELRTRLRSERSPWLHPLPEGGCLLAFAVPGMATPGWLLWLESKQRTTWSAAESAAFVLAAAAVGRTLDLTAASGNGQCERLLQQQQLEHAAGAVRRVAHDYGNVLTTILGFSELALTQPLPPNSPLHRYLTEVHRGAESGAELTQQLRLFSRRVAATTRPCPLAPILAEEQLRLHTAVDRQAHIELNLPANLPPAAIDGDPLRLVVRVLLENAVEAAPKPGSVTVTARTVAIAAEECLDYYGDVHPGPHVELRITDNGEGLSPDVLRQLFAEPFFSTKPRRRGYGLLAAYGVLCSHRGGLRLTNAPTRGALARLVLPVAVQPAPAISPSGTERQSGEKVLVVDDDPLVLRFAAGALENAGYRVATAANAEEAVAAHAASGIEPFRLVLSDVVMPRISGVELARRLLHDDAEVRFLFMSGHAPSPDVPKEIAGRSCELLQKPFRLEGLLRAVRTALERGPARRGLGRAAASRDESVVSTPR